MKKIKFLLPVLAAILILFVLFSRIDIGEIREVFNESNKPLLALSPLILLLAHVVSALRWKIILRMLGRDIGLKTIIRLYLANIPVTKIVPLYGGDFMRAYYLKDKVPVAKHAGGIFLGMVLDVAALATLAILGGLVIEKEMVYFSGLAIITVLILFYYLALIFKKSVPPAFRGKFENFLYAFNTLIRHPRMMFLIIMPTFVAWFLVMLYIKLTFLAFDVNMPLLPIIALQPLVTLVSLLPITVWGVGTRETAMLILFSALAPGTVILAVGVTYSFVGAVLLPLLFVPLTYKIIREIAR